MTESPAIGIDLGTTYSCVGIFQKDQVEILENDLGRKATPSYVAFTDNEILIGDEAKEQATRNLCNTVFDAKRLIGRTFDDATVQADMKHWPFEVVNDDTKPKIKVEFQGEAKTFHPEEISSMVLRKMKEIAEAYLDKPVTKAVITVPAYFNDAQRQATKDAGKICGLNVLRIINEPTAAAIAYGLDKKVGNARNVLIFDLGGGTFDVSILNIKKGVLEVKSTAGNTHLGGEDFDNRMVDYFVQEFNSKYQKDLTQNKRAMRRLKCACERAKRNLSTSGKASIDIDSLHESIDFYSSITRDCFEELNAELFQNTMEYVEKAISDANMTKEQIHEVVLVGGSSRIPKVQNLLQDFFKGIELYKSINPDEAVAYGAAVQAAILSGNKCEKIRDLVLVDITSLSLGINVLGEETAIVVQRNTSIPTKETSPFTTSVDYQTEVSIKVYEGEFLMTAKNNYLGEFLLTGIPSAPAGVEEIDVTFDIDANGILKVTAVNKSTGSNNQIVIKYNKHRFSDEEIERMINDANKYNAMGKRRKAYTIAKDSLESYCLTVKNTITNELADKIDETDKSLILEMCEKTLHWIKSNPTVQKKKLDDKLKELESVFDKILKIADNPEEMKKTYSEVLNVGEGATSEEIEDGFRDAALKYHPDKYEGDEEVASWMFNFAVKAKKYLFG